MDQTIQITFCTKDQKIAVSSIPIALSCTTTPDDLNTLLNELLLENGNINEHFEFTFFIDNEVLTSSIREFMDEKQSSLESVEIEYCEKQKPPIFEKEIEQDDLVSCVKRKGKYILTGSYDGFVRIWNVEQKNPVLVVELAEKVKCVEWIHLDPNQNGLSLFVSGGFDQCAYLWSWNTDSSKAECVAICRGHSETVMTAVRGPNVESNNCVKHFATGSWDGTIKVWSASSDEIDLTEETGGIGHRRKSTDKAQTRIPLITLGGHRETITQICWNSTQLISSSWDRTLRIWDSNALLKQTATELRCIVANHAIHDIDWREDQILTASSDNVVRIYDPKADNALVLSGFQGHTSWLTSIAWAPHQSHLFVTGSVDRSVRLWDCRNPRAPLYNLMGHADMVTYVDWAPPYMKKSTANHYILSASADATIKVYRFVD